MKFKLKQSDIKQGVASIYVVVFATILFGIITLSFTKIIISEADQSSKDDLSQSAYDSALAGVEDAKVMINRYYECINKNGAGAETCGKYNIFSATSANCEDGFPLAQKLYNTNGEVKVQEDTANAINASADTAIDQAYTCVIVTDTTSDYRGTLTSDTRTRVIPIGVSGASGSNSSSNLSKVKRVKFSWFSELNQGNRTDYKSSPDLKFNSADQKTVPPTVQLQFISTRNPIDINAFHSPNNGTNGNINSTMVFLPQKVLDSGTPANTVSTSDISANGNAFNGDNTNKHSPIGVECSRQEEFVCSVTLEIGGLSLGTSHTALLVASLPYGDAFTDFSVTLYDESNKPIDFKGAQISVDSTGRTNQLFRRVETRLDPADLFYPYPQYALELDGGDDDSLKKNFWVTSNCWTESGTCSNNGELSK